MKKISLALVISSAANVVTAAERAPFAVKSNRSNESWYDDITHPANTGGGIR